MYRPILTRKLLLSSFRWWYTCISRTWQQQNMYQNRRYWMLSTGDGRINSIPSSFFGVIKYCSYIVANNRFCWVCGCLPFYWSLILFFMMPKMVVRGTLNLMPTSPFDIFGFASWNLMISTFFLSVRDFLFFPMILNYSCSNLRVVSPKLCYNQK